MRLKRISLLFIILLIFCSLLSAGRLGIGIILGDPNGISMKFWQSQRTAIDLALAWDFDDYFHIHGDYLYHFPIQMEERSWKAFPFD